MSIRREDLSKMNFSDLVEAGDKLPPVHPGEILFNEFMAPLELSSNALANALHVPANRISGIVKGTRAVTGDTALRLARYFGTTAEFWLGLQKAYELEKAKREALADIEKEVAPRAA